MSDVSVIIPTYNRRFLLEEALESVWAQELAPAEVVVVDDGSTDGTAEALAPLGARIRLFRQDNRGVSAARNRGLREARSAVVCFLDSDDRLERHALKCGLAGLTAETSMLIFSGVSFGHEGARELFTKVLEADRYTAASLLGEDSGFNPVWGMARRDELLAIGGFDEMLPTAEDYDLALRLCASGRRVEVLREPVYRHRRAVDRLTASSDEVRNFRMRLRALDRFEREYPDVARELSHQLVAARGRFGINFWRECVKSSRLDPDTVREARSAIRLAWTRQPLRLRLIKNMLLYGISPMLCSKLGLR